MSSGRHRSPPDLAAADPISFQSRILALWQIQNHRKYAFLIPYNKSLCSAAKKEIVAATIIAELWNGRVSDKIEIVRRTQQFNQLVELQNQETERLLSAGPKTSEQEQEAAGSITKNVSQNGYSGSPVAGSAAKSTSQAPRATESAAVGNANDGTARLQQSNLLLQRRVEALENSEGNLRQRLNQTTLLLDEERRRNATLKGA